MTVQPILKYLRVALLLAAWLLILVGLVVWGANAYSVSSAEGATSATTTSTSIPSSQVAQAGSSTPPCPTKDADKVAGVRPTRWRP